MSFVKAMIYSKIQQSFVPVTVSKKSYDLKDFGIFTKYSIFDKRILLGHVDLQDTPKGVFVEFIENLHPDLYSGFGKLADQIEVEHCLNRGLDTFEINSDAALNSHAVHYLRGKRFKEIRSKDIAKEMMARFQTQDPNIIVQKIINLTPKGEKYITNFLGKVSMFMPKEMINRYLEIIKRAPILK